MQSFSRSQIWPFRLDRASRFSSVVKCFPFKARHLRGRCGLAINGATADGQPHCRIVGELVSVVDIFVSGHPPNTDCRNSAGNEWTLFFPGRVSRSAASAIAVSPIASSSSRITRRPASVVICLPRTPIRTRLSNFTRPRIFLLLFLPEVEVDLDGVVFLGLGFFIFLSSLPHLRRHFLILTLCRMQNLRLKFLYVVIFLNCNNFFEFF